MAFRARNQHLQQLWDDEDLLLAAALLLLRDNQRREERRRRGRIRRAPRSVWVRPWLLRRPLFRHYDHLMQELNREDVREYKHFIRVSPELFMEVLHRVGPRIQKFHTNWRAPLEPGLKIAITLRYLATGNSYKSLQYGFRVAANTISLFIPETCEAIIQEFSETHMRCPKTPEQWKQVSQRFSTLWNFHNCLGAIDGKHIAIRKPKQSRTYYYNYKGFFSIVLMAVADADYKFLFVDIGANGSCADSGIFKLTNIYKAVMSGVAGIPNGDNLPHVDSPVPYSFIGDDAFGLRSWMMKPHPSRGLTKAKRIFNYRLSRARRVVENAFGILAQR